MRLAVSPLALHWRITQHLVVRIIRPRYWRMWFAANERFECRYSRYAGGGWVLGIHCIRINYRRV